MRGARITVIAVALGAVLLTGCTEGVRSPSGTPTASASIGAYDVRVGDCTGALPSGSITSLELIPCDQSHSWEVFHSGKLTDESYPGQAKVYEDGNKLCRTAFTMFVGIKPEKSTLTFTFFHPNEETWQNTGDREVLCILGSTEGGLVGSAKGLKK